MNDLIPASEHLVATDQRHLIHPLHFAKDHANPKVYVSGTGSMLRTADGREYIDALSSLWNVNIGHGRKELATAAATQMEQLAYASAYTGFTNEPAIRLAEKIVSLAYSNMAAVYFTTGGAESNESAFKFAPLSLEADGQAEQGQDHLPPLWLSWRHHGGDECHQPAELPQDVRPAGAGVFAGRAALPLSLARQRRRGHRRR